MAWFRRSLHAVSYVQLGRSSTGIGLGCALALFGCKPASVSEAEAKSDIGWLTTNGSPEAMAALGRLADKEPKAATALSGRAATDVNVYIAAWGATVRGSAWGPNLLREALLNPVRAEEAAAVMTRRDPHLQPFVPDLEAALGRVPSTSTNVSSVLASIGLPAHASVVQRLADAKTRGKMCRGIAAPQASDDARGALLAVDSTSRDDPACVDTVARLAASDDKALAWMATTGEPGLLSAAGKNDVMPCPRLVMLWTQAIASRPPNTHVTLAVPLAHAVKRCPAAMDPLLAETIVKNPGAQTLIVGGVDPYGTETPDLKKTCAVLPQIANAKNTGVGRTKDRAADALAHGCHPPTTVSGR